MYENKNLLSFKLHTNHSVLSIINSRLTSRQSIYVIAKHFNISKVTVGKYLKSGLLYNKLYRFKVIQD